jgi:restriction system protein
MEKSDITVPSSKQLMWPVLCVLKDLGGSASHRELLDKIIEKEHISEEAQSVPNADGRSKLSYNLYRAKNYLGAFGAIENTARGLWAISNKGRSLTKPDVKKIPGEVQLGWDSRRIKGPQNEDAGSSPAEPKGVDEALSDWKSRLLTVLTRMPADAFERLAQRILREKGFVKVEVKGKSGDGGIDGVGVLRMADLLSFRVHFQCKRWKSSIPSSAIREFQGALAGRTDKGLFITTATFTADARREATRDGAPPIDLVDGDQLCDILRSLRLGVSTVENVEVDTEWFEKL